MTIWPLWSHSPLTTENWELGTCVLFNHKPNLAYMRCSQCHTEDTEAYKGDLIKATCQEVFLSTEIGVNHYPAFCYQPLSQRDKLIAQVKTSEWFHTISRQLQLVRRVKDSAWWRIRSIPRIHMVEKTESHKLSSDLHMVSVAYMGTHGHTYNISICK